MLASVKKLYRFVSEHPLTKQHRWSAMSRVIGWQVTSRIGSDVHWDWIPPVHFVARRGMTGVTGNIYAGLHEWPEMAFLLHYLRPSDLFLDVGANVGSYTLLASGVIGAPTIAYEPDPGTAERLRKNISSNHLTGRVTVLQAAAGASPGNASMTIGRDTTNRIASDGGQTVPIVTLDDTGAGATFIKMDIEGYEAEALKGAGAVLASPALQAVIIEDRAAAARVLPSLGFTEIDYDPFTRSVFSGPASGKNAIYIRNAGDAAARVKAGKAFRVLSRRI